MKSQRMKKAPNGFGLIELVIAILAVGVAAAMIPQLAEFTRAETDHGARSAAQRIAANEVERLLAAAPWAPPASVEWTVDESGTPASTGRYQVRIHRTVECAGGPRVDDNALSAPVPGGCGSAAPVARYHITVRFPSRSTESAVDSVTRTLLRSGEGRGTIHWDPAGTR